MVWAAFALVKQFYRLSLNPSWLGHAFSLSVEIWLAYATPRFDKGGAPVANGNTPSIILHGIDAQLDQYFGSLITEPRESCVSCASQFSTVIHRTSAPSVQQPLC